MTDDSIDLDIEQGTIQYTPRRQIYFGARYSVLFPVRFERVIDNLTARDFRMIFTLIRFCEIGNTVDISRARLARHTGISENHISTIMGKLERLEIISILQRGQSYRLNEDFFWRGTAEAYQERRRETRIERAALSRDDPEEGSNQ